MVIYTGKTMALYPASGCTGFSDSYATPANSPDVISTGSVDLILPTGIIQQVFGTRYTALKCILFTEQQKLYSPSPNEEGIINNLRSELLILENSYINEEVMNSYGFSFIMETKFKQLVARWLTWFAYQRHLLLLVLGVLGFHGVPVSAQNLKLTGLIKTDLVFKLSVMFIKVQLYTILIFRIPRLL